MRLWDTTNFSLVDAIYNFLGIIFPNCRDALKLVEKGQETPLKWHEKFALKYNSPLCLHCNCNREKFDKEYGKENRRSRTHGSAFIEYFLRGVVRRVELRSGVTW